MAFDLATARPVGAAGPPARGGFDLTSARPVMERGAALERMKRENPGEYDPQSPEYQAKYGTGGAGAVVRDVGRAALRSPVTLADAALSTGRQMVAAPVAGIAGLVTAPAGFVPGMEGVGARNVERVQQFIGGQPFTEGGREVTEAVAYPFERLAEGADWAGGHAADFTGSPAIGAGVNAAIQTVPALLLRGRVGRGNRGPDTAGAGARSGETAPRAAAAAEAERPARLGKVSGKAPSIEELKAAKDAAYERAEATGVVVSRNAMNRLKVELVDDLKKEGLHKTLHPKSAAALQEILRTKGQPTLTQLETLRKIANDARMAPDAADARLGSRIIDGIDDFEASLGAGDVISGDAAAATAFSEARALNQRLSKARTIQKLFDDAELAVGANYTAAGMDTALRQQFRALAKNDRRLRGFTPEERAAIRKVVLGGKVQNAMRVLGKFAPSGVVSSLAGIGAVGVAGPGGLALPAAGIVARQVSAKMGLRNAGRASEMVRGAPIEPLPALGDVTAATPRAPLAPLVRAESDVPVAQASPQPRATGADVTRPANAVSQAQPEAVIRDLVQRVRKAPAGDNTHAVIVFADTVHPDAAKAFAGAGVDVSGYRHVIDSSAVRHALNRHGDATTEAARGRHLAITEDDFARIPEVVSTPDKVAYIGKTNIGREAVRYVKDIGGELFVVIEARTKRKQLAVTSVRKVARHDPMPPGGDRGSNVQTLGGTLPQPVSTNPTNPLTGEQITLSGSAHRNRIVPVEQVTTGRNRLR
ncbi:MAG: hypothetical protein IT480_06460 [Gammaproteobacteria bacterium]|nr:hypothetical protein [Gammaproteobacteria bacterium]